MPTIEFRTYNKDSFEMFRPVAAKSMQPEWWKKSKIRVDHRGRVAQTIRSCPAMQDWLTMGYYIVASEDIPIRNGSDWDWPDGGERFTTEEIQNFSSSHPSSQLVDSITYDGADGTVNDAFKITNFWNIKCIILIKNHTYTKWGPWGGPWAPAFSKADLLGKNSSAQSARE